MKLTDPPGETTELFGCEKDSPVGRLPEREMFPPTLLLTVTVWLVWAPFNATLKVTGLGLMPRPDELPPFTVRVTFTTAC